MEITRRPRLEIAQRSLPASLLKVIGLLFLQNLKGCMLVGGTALSGFYGGYRRSDDIDLFVESEEAKKGVVLAIRALEKKGVVFSSPFETAHYFRTTAAYEEHTFTIDVALDSHLFQIGRSVEVEGGIRVADLETLLITKIATLVSRCSEKDLYDLIWILDHVEGMDYAKLLELGKKWDGGFTGEGVLLSLAGATLKEEACDFALDPSQGPHQIYRKLLSFRNELVKNLNTYLRNEEPLPLKKLVDRVRRLAGSKKKS